MKRRNRAQDTTDDDDELKVNFEFKTFFAGRNLQFLYTSQISFWARLCILFAEETSDIKSCWPSGDSEQRESSIQQVRTQRRLTATFDWRPDKPWQFYCIERANQEGNRSSSFEDVSWFFFCFCDEVWCSFILWCYCRKSIAPQRSKTPPLDMYATPYTNTLVSILRTS